MASTGKAAAGGGIGCTLVLISLALAAVTGCAGILSGHSWDWFLGGDTPVQFPKVATLANEQSFQIAHYDLLAKNAAGQGLWLGLCDVASANVTVNYARHDDRVQSMEGGRHISMKDWGLGRMRPMAVDQFPNGGDYPVVFTNHGLPATLVVGVVEEGANPDLLLAECPRNTMGFTVGDAIRRGLPPPPP